MLKTYSMILSLLSPVERKRFFILLGLVFVLAVFEAISVLSILPFLQVLASPELIQTNKIFAELYQFGGFSTDRNFTIALGVLVFLVTVFGLIFKTIMVWVLTRFSMMRSYGLSARLLSGYLHQPYIWFLSRHSSDLSTGVLTEVDRMVSGSLIPAMRLIPDFLTAILLICAVFYFEPEVAVAATILLGGAYVLIYVWVRNLLLRIGTARLEANKTRFHVVQEAIGGIKELKLMALEDGFLHHFRVAAFRMAKAQTLSMVVSQIPRYALEALAFGGMILLVLVLMVRGDGNVTEIVPTLGLIAVTGSRLFPALQQIYSRITKIRFNEKTLERIHADIIGLDRSYAKTRRAGETLPPQHLWDTLELSHVGYQYPDMDKSALMDLSLTIKANTTIGIVGGTGAGKTTLVDIILGLLSPVEGNLIVDGTKITQHNIRAWQKSLGYVPQQIFLSDDTIAANIAFGTDPEKVDMAIVKNAARAASLDAFITSELPDGYLTKVGERGVRLSGGQRQRIGIARALYHSPDVLIMDEATSALDNLTERAVMEAVQNISGRKTIILIAHRLTTVKNCDNIFLLRQGGVAASGTYGELIKTDKEFREMATES